MNISFFELEGWEEPLVRAGLSGHELTFSKEKIDPSKPPEKQDADVLSVFINSRIEEKTLESFPNLKLIATRSTGYDHIDIAACAKRGIAVVNVPGYGEDAVAEYTFALLLALTRKLYPAISQVKEDCLFTVDKLRGSDIKGKTLGVVGTGKIGKSVIRIATGFGMNIVASDPYPDPAAAKSLSFEYVEFDELLKSADIITLHCPLTKETTHLINEQHISQIKKGAFLINTARGGVIDTQALVKALKSGILAGAALDVLEEENEIQDELAIFSHSYINDAERLRNIVCNHILRNMEQVLITPHNAFNTNEALERILRVTLESIETFAKTGDVVNKVGK